MKVRRKLAKKLAGKIGWKNRPEKLAGEIGRRNRPEKSAGIGQLEKISFKRTKNYGSFESYENYERKKKPIF